MISEMKKFKPSQSLRRQSGVTMLEVLLAIAVFVFGMLALASLQGNLTRSSSDSNQRTVAANIAEELIEQMRSFEQISSETGKRAFNDIANQSLTVNRGGLDYSATATVVNWFFLADGTATKNTSDLPTGRDATRADFKHVTLNITWSGGEFAKDEGNATTGRLGTGAFQVQTMIPSFPPLGAAKLAAEDDGALAGPPVNYTPGLAPEIVRLTMGNERFKESTTPEPVTVRTDELVETWFDVITYSQATGEAAGTFLRREEFVAISCECQLDDASGTGRQPTIWTGAEYKEGAEVTKWTGVSSSNQQSQFCDVCCRDHHDTSTGGVTSYRPNQTAASGNHAHYNRNKQGDYVLATKKNDTYLEACRLVRKDGFFRVAQDFQLEEINAFPQDYLLTTSQVSEYSGYVNKIAESEFGSGTAPASPATELSFDGRDATNRTALPMASGLRSQQLRSRGVYMDTASADLTDNLKYCFGVGGSKDASKCEAPDALSAMELYPFFELQLTGLARWSEEYAGDPIEVTNEELSNQGYSRGLTELAGSENGPQTIISKIEDGNVGLISTIPVTTNPAAGYLDGNLYMQAGTGTGTPGGSITVTGTITNEGGTSDAAVATLTGTGAGCTKPTNSSFLCVIDPAATSHTVKVSNYWNKNFTLIACSDELTAVSSVTGGASAAENETVFTLPPGGQANITITIAKAPCN